MRKRNALAKLVLVVVFTSIMPLLMFSCSGNDPLLGFRQPTPRPDTGRDGMMQQEGASDEGGEAGEAGEGGAADAPADSTVTDAGIDTGADTGVDALTD